MIQPDINTIHAVFVSAVRDFQRLELIKALQESSGTGAEAAIRQAAAALGLNNIQTKRPQRKPSIKKMIAAAERAGKSVTSITTPDGTTLHFGKVEDTEASNPWLAGIDDKVTKQ